MSLYETEFDADWTDLSRDEATARAYAIGVAEKLGEENREELQEIYHEMDTAYNKSMVELAYQEGRREASEATNRLTEESDDVWSALVEGEFTLPERADDSLTGGRNKLPSALALSELLDKFDGKTSATDKPDFLER